MRAPAVGMMFALLVFPIPKGAPPRSNEPFTSFRDIDKQLSLIDARSARLKAASPPERSRSIRDIRTAVGRIRQRSQRLATRYRKQNERFGVKMFNALDKKAVSVSQVLTVLQRSDRQSDRDRAVAELNKATLDVVLQFQAISSNYGANHCEARQWACCEPKRDPETNRERTEGCKWTCVAKPRACVGFLGPQTLR